MRYHKIIFVFLFCCSVGVLSAQRDLPSESVEIIKSFDARLLESNKLKVTPVLPPLDTSTKAQTYTVPPRPLSVNYEAPKLRPIGMKAAAKEKQYNGFIKAGGGIPTSIYGEGGYYFGAKDKFDGKLWARHHSANFKSKENQKFYNNDFLLNGNYYINENNALEVKAAYSADRVHFYGYNDDSLSIEDERVRQNYNIFDLGARLYNGRRNETDLNYFIAPKVYSMSDFYSNSESGFDMQFGATKWFSEKHPLRVTIRTDLSRFKDTAVQKLNNIYLQPSFTFHNDFIRFKVGGNFASNRDVFHIYPDAELNLRVFGDGFQIFAVAAGDLRKNTFRSLSEYNPFVEIRTAQLKNTDYRTYYGGLKGNLGWLDYTGQVGYSTANNLALFQTLFTDEGVTRFSVVYDTAQIFNIQGTVKLTPVKNLTVSGTLSQSVYEMANETGAWGLPGLEGNFSAVYKVMEGKASVKAECYIADRIRRLDEDGRPGKDNALLDFSFGGNYYFSEKVGAFLDINNLLNNRRQRWHNYPMYGMNILVGITARF